MIAFKTYSMNPTNTSIHLQKTPWQMQNIDVQDKEKYVSENWTVLSVNEYEEYLRGCQSEIDAHEEEMSNTEITRSEDQSQTTIGTFRSKKNCSTSTVSFNIIDENLFPIFRNLEECDLQISVRSLSGDLNDVPFVYIQSISNNSVTISIKKNNTGFIILGGQYNGSTDNNKQVVVYLQIIGELK